MFMSKFKYLFVMLFAVVLTGGVIVSCSDDDDNVKTAEGIRAEGVKAGTEMCDCVASYEAPVQPQHPASPLPPASFDPTLDYSDPAVVEGMELDAYIYFMAPAIQAYLGELAVFVDEFETYAGNLYQCLGTIHPYQEYATANANNYDPEAEDPLLSVFTFKDDNFKEGFKVGVGSCADTFSALFSLIQ